MDGLYSRCYGQYRVAYRCPCPRLDPAFCRCHSDISDCFLQFLHEHDKGSGIVPAGMAWPKPKLLERFRQGETSDGLESITVYRKRPKASRMWLLMNSPHSASSIEIEISNGRRASGEANTADQQCAATDGDDGTFRSAVRRFHSNRQWRRAWQRDCDFQCSAVMDGDSRVSCHSRTVHEDTTLCVAPISRADPRFRMTLTHHNARRTWRSVSDDEVGGHWPARCRHLHPARLSYPPPY